MKNVWIIVGAFLSLTVFFGAMVSAQSQFSDVQGNKYQESIEYLAANNLVSGYDNGEFRPNQPINRAELLTMVFRAKEESVGDGKNCFSDVQEQWFAPFVCEAKKQEIVSGHPDGSYKPGDNVNMVEAFKIIMEAFEMPVADLQEGQDWYVPYRDFAHNNNLFSQYSYLPWGSANRGEIAFLVHKMKRLDEGDDTVSLQRYAGSAGCGSDEPSTPPTSFLVHGVERSTITVVPGEYSKNKPISLVFAFHGRTNPNSMVRTYYRVEEASAGQAIIVYPAGMPNGSGFNWADSGDKASDLRDYEFFDVMLEKFTSDYCINMDEIYVVGHSLGAWFSNSLACARGDVIRGAATLGGSRANSDCSGPAAVMQWHNPEDQLAPFSGALTTRDWYRQQNQCGIDTVAVEPSWGNCVEYQGCYDYARTVWCPHTQHYGYNGAYYPHNWPKDTGAAMWDFLSGLE